MKKIKKISLKTHIKNISQWIYTNKGEVNRKVLEERLTYISWKAQDDEREKILKDLYKMTIVWKFKRGECTCGYIEDSGGDHGCEEYNNALYGAIKFLKK